MPKSKNLSYEKALAKLTNTRAALWESSNGPDTRCGVDYYFVHRRSKIEAYINWDQGCVTITVDGENVFSGMEQELPQ
jgi:hypothetical protein